MNDHTTLRGGIAVPANPFPLLPLRSIVLFPGTVLTLPVGRSRSIALLEAVRAGDVIPHACQHTFTLRALRGGSDLVAVSKLLGHALVATTRAYLDHLAMEALRAALPDLPLGGRS